MTARLLEFLKKSIVISGKKVHGRLFLAPMAGLGHIGLREMISEYGGCALLFSGMCSAKTVIHENRFKSTVFSWRDQELSSLVCQLFGNSPEIMAEASMRIENEGFFGVDLNFGCSVMPICKQNCGAALLKDLSLCRQIVESVRKAVKIPIFVKFRTGWEDNPRAAVKAARVFEDAGADALVFHPRVAPDRRTRPPKWEYIKMVKEAVLIPVFGNGNVIEEKDCAKMIETTGCDGVSIGRIAVARPWIFASWTNGFVPDADTYLNCFINMATLFEKYFEPVISVKLFKKFARYFAANFCFGHSIYTGIVRADNIADIKNNILKHLRPMPEVSLNPNMNMLL